jgi:hypothetical protein
VVFSRVRWLVGAGVLAFRSQPHTRARTSVGHPAGDDLGPASNGLRAGPLGVNSHDGRSTSRYCSRRGVGWLVGRGQRGTPVYVCVFGLVAGVLECGAADKMQRAGLRTHPNFMMQVCESNGK